MYVFEINNLTMNPDNKGQYLINPTTDHSVGKIYYPITFPRLERIWVSKDIVSYTVEKVLPYIDVWGGQEEYDSYTTIKQDTIYRIWEEDEIKILYFNRRAYGGGTAPDLAGDATIFISPDGVIITDIMSSDARILINSPVIGTSGDASQSPIDPSTITDITVP